MCLRRVTKRIRHRVGYKVLHEEMNGLLTPFRYAAVEPIGEWNIDKSVNQIDVSIGQPHDGGYFIYPNKRAAIRSDNIDALNNDYLYKVEYADVVCEGTEGKKKPVPVVVARRFKVLEKVSV